MINDIGKILRNLKVWSNKPFFTPKRSPRLAVEQMRCAETVPSFGVPCIKPIEVMFKPKFNPFNLNPRHPYIKLEPDFGLCQTTADALYEPKNKEDAK